MFSSRDNLIGIAAMLVAMIGFVSNDTQVKLASESLPLGEVMFLRGVATVLIITAIVFMQGHQRHLASFGTGACSGARWARSWPPSCS